MKLGLVSFVAALVAAPLAAQAAEPPARFAVTLRATVSERVTFHVTTSQEDCVTTRSGTGGRRLTIRSSRPARIRVTPGPVYRPSRVGVIVVGGTVGSDYEQTRRCRAGPLETSGAICKPKKTNPRRVRAAFRRSAPGVLVFRSVTFGDVQPCGLDQPVPGGWLGIAPGSIDEAALQAKSSRIVLARGAATRETILEDTATTKITRQTTVRWTLRFRRLG